MLSQTNKYFSILIACTFILAFESRGQVYVNDAPINNIIEFYGPAIIGGGVSFADFDNDGWDDLTFSSCAGDSMHFYKNNNGIFQKIVPCPVSNTSEVKQILWADYDNDGDRDLFLASNMGSNRLYNNDGGLNLTDVTVQSGINTSPSASYSANWFDYNRDGLLDLLITNYMAGVNDKNELYRNNGNGTFTDIAANLGVEDSAKQTLASACFDYNNDTWPDIYTAQDKHTLNSLYCNNQNGSFFDVSGPSKANLSMNSMSATIGDYDNNGFLDIYITNTQAGNRLLKNLGDSSFAEVSSVTGTTFNGVGWGAQFLDYDLDGDLDLYVSGNLLPSQGGPSSAFYQNLGNGSFNLNLNSGFAGDTVRSYGNAVGDINHDGFPDIAVCNLDVPHQIWRNTTGNGTWLKIKLKGVLSNVDGIGTWIEVYAKNKKQVKYTVCGQSFISQNSFTEFFGLDNAVVVDSIILKWPSGIVDKHFNLSVNQSILFSESETHCSAFNPITITSSVKKITCSGNNNAAISNIISGGTSPYYYFWNSSLQPSLNNVSDIGSGFYSFIVKDAVNCAVRKKFYVNQVEPLLVQAQINHPGAAGNNDGSIDLNSSGGTGALKYFWSNGATSNAVSGLNSGVYFVKIHDENKCTNLQFFTLIDP